MSPTEELNKFIHKIQVKSRVIVDGKVLRMTPVQETIKFKPPPTEDNFSSCYVYFNYPVLNAVTTL